MNKRIILSALITAIMLCITACDLLDSGTDNGGSTNNDPPVDYTLAEGSYFRMIYPNGGEKINYGDTITIKFVVDINKAKEVIVALNNGGPGEGCTYADDTEWFIWPHDSSGTGVKSMRMVDPDKGIVYGELKVKAVDGYIDGGGCNVVYEGDNLKFQVFDPYGDEKGCSACQAGDFSDASFSIINKTK